MQFQKGNNANPNGRPKKNIRETQDELRFMLYDFLKANFADILTDLDTLDTKSRIRVFIQLMKHVEPRMVERPQQLNIEDATEEQLDEIINKIAERGGM